MIFSDRCLHYMDRFYIPITLVLNKAILYKAHVSATRHLGYAKILNAIRKKYHWIGLKGDVLYYVH